MSDDLPALLLSAWQRLQPLIQRDPDELARRLARRRTGIMLRPPRAWCLAVRASDQRIHPGVAACVPEDAAYPYSAIDPALRKYAEFCPLRQHQVTLDAKLLRRLSRPYYVPAPGLEMADIARDLGVSISTLKAMT